MLRHIITFLSLYASISTSTTISCSEVSPCYVFQSAPMKYTEPVYTIPTTKCVLDNGPTIKENSVKNSSSKEEKVNKKDTKKDKKKSKKLL